MTISSTDDPRAGPFNGNGVQTAFPFEFKVFSDEDLLVVQTDADGVKTTLVLDSDYSVALNADQDADPGGTVTATVAPPTGETLTITSDLDFTQTMDLTNGGGFYPQVVENAIDRAVMLIKQVNSKVLRSLQLGVSTPDGVDVTLPAPVANHILGWDADGASLANYAPDTSTSTAELENRLGSTASASVGGGLVGWLRSISYTGNTVGRWLKWLFTRSVDVTSYATGGTGTSADPWTGWDTAITWAARTSYVFGDGYYAYATSPNFALTWLELRTTKATVLQHTGTGYALLLDGGAAGDGVYFISIKGGGKLESNSGATGGMYVRAVHHWDFDLAFRNIPGNCIETHWSVHCRAKINKAGALSDGQTVASAVGAYFDRRGVGETTTAWHIENPRFYGCTSVGMDFVYSADMVVMNGAVEQAPLGIRVSGTAGACYRINLNGIDLEGNTKDMEYGGSGGVISGINSTTRTDVVSGARGNVFLGGMYNNFEWKAGAIGNLATGITVAQDGGTYTAGGTDNVIENAYNSTSGATFGQASATIASAATITIPRGVRVALITGTTNITAITARDNSVVTLVFASGLTLGGANVIVPGGTVATSNNDTITLACLGSNWFASPSLLAI